MSDVTNMYSTHTLIQLFQTWKATKNLRTTKTTINGIITLKNSQRMIGGMGEPKMKLQYTVNVDVDVKWVHI